jgi:flagellar protein FliL
MLPGGVGAEAGSKRNVNHDGVPSSLSGADPRIAPELPGIAMAKAKKDKTPAPEAEAEEDGAAVAEPVKKKLPMKLIIAGAAGAVVVLGGGGVGAVLLLGGGKAEAHKPAHKKPAAKDGDKKDGPNPISQGPDGAYFYTMPDMVVNIQSPDGRPTYLKLKLALETPDEDSAEAITPNQLRLNDMFQSFLRELRPDDLAGSQGSYELRQEIQRRVNLVIAPSKVNAVLIQEMLVQ